MAAVPPLPRTPEVNGRYLDAYTQGLTTAEVERLFTRDTPEACRFFSRHIDVDSLAKLPWHRRALARARLLFVARFVTLFVAALRSESGELVHVKGTRSTSLVPGLAV